MRQCDPGVGDVEIGLLAFAGLSRLRAAAGDGPSIGAEGALKALRELDPGASQRPLGVVQLHVVNTADAAVVTIEPRRTSRYPRRSRKARYRWRGLPQGLPQGAPDASTRRRS